MIIENRAHNEIHALSKYFYFFQLQHKREGSWTSTYGSLAGCVTEESKNKMLMFINIEGYKLRIQTYSFCFFYLSQ